MWLIADDTYQEMRARLDLGLTVTDALQAEFAAQAAEARSDEQPRNMRVAGDVAEIDVVGLLTPKPDFWAWLFGYGNTTYEQIEAALAMAAADPEIKRVVFNVDSPGGQVDGLFECAGAIEAFSKPKSVRARLAASAAYVIAALGGKIEATNQAATFGSIGVVVTYFTDETKVEITSTQAPDKRPDPTTPEGQAKIREYLDALHDLMVDRIASGRKTTAEDVNTNFGRGAVVVAKEAKRRGMIDKIAGPQLRAVTIATPTEDATAADTVAGKTVAESSAATKPEAAPAGGAAQKKGKIMDLQTLKSEHPDTYAAAVKLGREEGHTAGLKEGADKERDRVTAHLIRGKASGAMDLAIESVEVGAEMTETLRAKYDTAKQNKDDQAARQRESDDAGAAVDGAATTPKAQDMADKVADLLYKDSGLAG